MKAVVLAGGSGTRLWPDSTPGKPKQFLDLNGDGALLFQTLCRTANFCAKEDIYVISRPEFDSHIDSVMQEFHPETAKDNVIFEPMPRNTAAAILLAAKYLESRPGTTLDDVMLVLPSDHLINDFYGKLNDCFLLGRQLAKEGKIVVFGIVPDKPETGFGYIKLSRPFETPKHPSKWMAESMPVQAFVEKPPLHVAEEYLAGGEHLWNAGIFAMSLKTLYSELETYFPGCKPYLGMDYETLYQNFGDVPKTSFDFAVMEKTQRAVVVPMHIDWSDVGSWDSIYDMLPKDDANNGIQGHVLATNTIDSLLVNRTSKPLVIDGMNNMIIIKTEDGLLVTARGQSQQIGTLTAPLLAAARQLASV